MNLRARCKFLSGRDASKREDNGNHRRWKNSPVQGKEDGKEEPRRTREVTSPLAADAGAGTDADVDVGAAGAGADADVVGAGAQHHFWASGEALA